MIRSLRKLVLLVAMLSLAESVQQLFTIGSFIVTPSKVAVALLGLVGVLTVLFEPARLPRDAKNGWLLVFLVSVTLGLAIAFLQGAPLGLLVVSGVALFAMILFYYLLAFVVRDHRDLDLALWGLVLGASLAAVTAILGIGRVSEGYRWTRVGGIGGNPNLLGFTIAIALPLALLLVHTQRARLLRLLALLLAGLLVAAMLGTLSRSALVSVAAMGGLWMLRFRRFDLLRWAAPVLAAGAVIVYTCAPPTLRDRVATMATAEARAEDTSIQARLVQDWYALQALGSNPLFGVGLFQFESWARQSLPPLHFTYTIHNAYLSVGAEQGLFGLVPFLAVLALAWVHLGRARRMASVRRRLRDPTLAKLGICATYAQIALLGTLIGSLFCPSRHYELFWVVLALATIVPALVRKRAAALRTQAAGPEPDASVRGLEVTLPGRPARLPGGAA